jgi:hypothetical protein
MSADGFALLEGDKRTAVTPEKPRTYVPRLDYFWQKSALGKHSCGADVDSAGRQANNVLVSPLRRGMETHVDSGLRSGCRFRDRAVRRRQPPIRDDRRGPERDPSRRDSENGQYSHVGRSCRRQVGNRRGLGAIQRQTSVVVRTCMVDDSEGCCPRPDCRRFPEGARRVRLVLARQPDGRSPLAAHVCIPRQLEVETTDRRSGIGDLCRGQNGDSCGRPVRSLPRGHGLCRKVKALLKSNPDLVSRKDKYGATPLGGI